MAERNESFQDRLPDLPAKRRDESWDAVEREKAAAEPGSEDRNLAAICHIFAFFTYFIMPLVVWQMKKDSSKFLSEHAKEALNFQITLTIYYAVGCLIFPVVLIYEIVYVVLAALAASRGELYRIPLNIRFIK